MVDVNFNKFFTQNDQPSTGTETPKKETPNISAGPYLRQEKIDLKKIS